MIKMGLSRFFFSFLMVALATEILVFAPEEVNSGRHSAMKETAAAVKAGEPEHTMVGVNVVETKEGQKEWELWAEKATGSKDQGDGQLERVKVQLFGEAGLFYIVTGDRGSFSSKKKDLNVEGHVVIRSSNGYTFSTSKMSYVSEKREILSPGDVLMRGSQRSEAGLFELRGRDLLADLTNGRILIQSDVFATKQIPEGQTVQIQSRSAEFSSKDQTAIFNEDVTVEMDGARITGPMAKFVFDKSSQQLRSLVVDGGARVTDVERWATAKKVEMLFQSDQFILSGAPRVVQNSDELTGEEIIYSRGGKEIQIHGVRARLEDTKKRDAQ